MQTRRDQLHAYRFQNRRALAALVAGEPNVLEPPMRRLTAMTVSGIMVAVLIAVGAAVVGLIKPSSGDKWKDAGAIIDERGTGARYVLFPGNVLHPVLNYSSAVLVVGASGSTSSKPHIVFVNSGDIKSAKRGALIGVDGLPDSVPSSSGLVSEPWTVCSRETKGTADHLDAEVGLSVGSTAGSAALTGGSAVYVRAVSDNTTYLLAQGHRYAISPDSPSRASTVATALDLGNQQALPVGTAFLNALPAGPQLAPPPIPDAGQPSGAVSIDGTAATVGRLIYTTDSKKYYLVLADGTAALTPMQTALFHTVALGSGGQTEGPINTTENAVLNAKPSTKDWPAVAAKLDGLPTAIPTVAPLPEQRGGVCAVYRKGAIPSLSVPAGELPSYVPSDVRESSASAHGTADSVTLASGHAALVRSSDGASTPFLIAAPGKKFAMPSAAVLSAFGFGSVTPAKLPAQLLALIPLGPPMDPTAARRPVAG